MLIKLAWKNIWRNRRRTLITVSAIAFAVLFAVAMRSMQAGMEAQMLKTSVENSLGYLQIHQKGYWDDKILDNGMSASDLPISKIEALLGVKSASKKLEMGMIASVGKNSRGTLILTVDEQKPLPKYVERNIVEGNAPIAGEKQILMGIELAHYLHLGMDDTVIFLGQGYQGATAAGLFTVSGLLDMHLPELNRSTAYMGLSDLQTLIDAPHLITALMIDLDHPSKMADVKTEIENLVGPKYEVMTWDEMSPELKQAIQTSGAKGWIMNFILYMIISFVMFGTVLMATQERKFELGVLEAIGMKKWRSVAMVTIENIFISIIGVVVGVLAVTPIAYYFAANPIKLQGDQAKTMLDMGIEPVIPFSTDPMIALNHGMIVLVISMCILLYPMLVIWKMKPIEAMKL